MRFFIALELPPENKQQLKVIQNELAKLIPQARITDNQKLHLTLAFLAEQPTEMLKSLTELIEKAVKGISQFMVTPAYIDGFPNLHHPHILWMGVKGDVDKLFLIREKLKDGLKELDMRIDERRYTPHIAIAKLDNFQMTDSIENALEDIATTPLDSIKVSSIKLFESIPEEGFHRHNTLAEISLQP